MSPRPQSLLIFILGVLLGGLGGWFVSVFSCNRGPTYELTRDVSLMPGYGLGAPLPAGVRSGQRFDVVMRKGDINYIRVYGVAFDRDLRGNTKNLPKPSSPAVAPWDRALPSSTSPKER